MDDHETRRKIIREWMALPKDKRQTAEQAAAFATKAVEQNEFHRSRRDPDQKFRRDPFEKVMGMAVAARRQVASSPQGWMTLNRERITHSPRTRRV
jgi:hypothetical protein